MSDARHRFASARDRSERRIERDVHDGIQQRLVQAVVHLQLAMAEAAGHECSAGESIEDALRTVQVAVRDLRDLVRGIPPAALTEGGLRAGIASLTAGLPLELDIDVHVQRLGAEVEITAYFVVAEALANVVKHARASTARVRVGTAGAPPHLVVEVWDDGVGGAVLGGGSGLVGLRDRVSGIGGRFDVAAGEHGGTVLRAVLPLGG